jgi:hypothetical protein
LSSPPALAKMLDTLAAFVRRYVAFASDAQSVAVALWIMHAHTVDAFDTTPYLHVASAEKRSGKSRLLEVLELLVPKPWYAIGPSEAVLYRRIEENCPTLLLDEVDAIFGKSRAAAERYEGLRAALNAGWRRGAKVPRCITNGKKIELVEFSVFCPKVLTGIGSLPDTVADRSIPIRLRRRAPGEPVDRFRRREVAPAAAMLAEALVGWSQEVAVLETLRDARPNVPEVLNDRAQDIWEALLAIADLAGGDWPPRARAAAIELCGRADDASEGVRLLSDIRDVFTARDVAAVPTAELLSALIEIEDAPWAERWSRDIEAGSYRRPASRLARLLGRGAFEVRPTKIRTGFGRGSPTAQGYRSDDFADAWARYCPPCSVLEGTFRRNTGTPQVTGLFDENGSEAENGSDQECSGVPSKTRMQTEHDALELASQELGAEIAEGAAP